MELLNFVAFMDGIGRPKSFPSPRPGPSGRPVAAENELGWALRGSRFLAGEEECDSTKEPDSIGTLARYN